MTLFDLTVIAVGILIVISAVRPTFNKAIVAVHQARETIRDVLRRKHSLSQQIRALAKESKRQRSSSVHDAEGAEGLHDTISSLLRRVEALEAVDRRVLVLDERRGQREVGWIMLITRQEPGLMTEPPRVTESWAAGRFVFFWAQDEKGARHRANLRFPESAGFQVLRVLRHEGDLAEPPEIYSGPSGTLIAEPASEPDFEEAAVG